MGAEAAQEGALGRAILRMTTSLDLGEVLREITHGLVEELDAALARIWLIGTGDTCSVCRDAPSSVESCLHLVSSAGLSKATDGTHHRIAMGALKIGGIAKSRAAVCTNELRGDPRIKDKDWVRREKLKSFAGYPLEFRGDVLGVLAMFGRRELTPPEVDRLGMFAAQAAIAIKNARLFDEVTTLSRRLQDENSYLQEELREERPTQILGDSPPLLQALHKLERVAPTMSTVLLLGETGTGKELFARALHERSPRRGRPLVKVNCAAMSPTLIESELFGHEKGAFTGAVARRSGRFELASGGTLFLDEIGELPLDAQAKLLRVVQEREFERVGGSQSLETDVRLVCATNRDLALEVRERRFREDLFYRLNVFAIQVPPLRERRGDIPVLANAFVRAMAKRLGRDVHGIEEHALGALCSYDWPGNVRELTNVIERGLILTAGPLLSLEDLPELGAALPESGTDLTLSAPAGEPRDETQGSLRQRVAAYELALIAEALRRCAGNQTEAARLLRMSRATLQYKIRGHRL